MTSATTEKLIQELARDLKPVKPKRSSSSVIFLRIVGVLAVVWLWIRAVKLRADLPLKMQELWFNAEWLWLTACGVIATFAFTWLGTPGRPGQRKMTKWSVYLVFLVAAMLLGHSFFHNIQNEMSNGLNPVGVACCLDVLFFSFIPFGILFWRAKKSASVRPGVTGALIGVACASFSAAGLAMHCNFDFSMHVLIWHFLLPVGILAALGAAIGSRALRW